MPKIKFKDRALWRAFRDRARQQGHEPEAMFEELARQWLAAPEPSATEHYQHPTAIVGEQARVGAGCKIWHFCHVMDGAELGPGCSLGQNVFVARGVVLGKGVKVQNNVSIYEGVVCEDEVFLGPSMVFTNVARPRGAYPVGGRYERTLVRRGATLGANCTVVCGHTVGAYAFVAAGAVVTKDVPDHALVMGNPARVVGWVGLTGKRLAFDSRGLATCPDTRNVYRLIEGRLESVTH